MVSVESTTRPGKFLENRRLIGSGIVVVYCPEEPSTSGNTLLTVGGKRT